MAAFDFSSGMQGAASGGSIGGPWGAIAGFVIGGFLGGGKKKRAEKKQKKLEKQLRVLASPEHLAATTKKLTPQFREQIAGGAGAELTGAIQTGVARRGLTGTGIGTALTAGAAAVPETMAFREALGQAQDVVGRQIAVRSKQRTPEATGYAEEFGQFADATQMFKQLSAGGGSPGELVSFKEGGNAPWDESGSAASQFSEGLPDFSQFQARR